MKLGVSLPVFTADPARPLAVAARARRTRARRRVLTRPLLPAGLLPALGPGPTGAGGVLGALGGGGAAPGAARRDPGRPRHASSAGDPRQAGRGARRDVGRSRDPGTRHRRPRLPARTRAVRLPVPAGRRPPRAAGGDGRGASRPVRRPQLWPGGSHVPAMAGPLLPPGAPAVWVGGLSDAVVAVAAPGGRCVERVGARRRRVRGARSNGCARLADGRPVDADVGRHRPGGGGSRRPRSACCAARAEKGLPVDGVWTGTADELRAVRRRPRRRRARRGSWCCPPGRPTAST